MSCECPWHRQHGLQADLAQIKDELGGILEIQDAALGVLKDTRDTLAAFLAAWEAQNPSHPATSAVLKLSGGTMPGSITVDTTNETVTLGFVDDHGDTNAAPPVAASGAALVVTFVSDTPSVLTVATDASNPLQGDVTPVAEGTANLSATLAYADGTPVLEADGVTPFPVPAAVAVTVGAGAAVGDALTLSV